MKKTFRTYNEMFDACLAYVTTEKTVYYKGREVLFSEEVNSCQIKTSNGWENLNRRIHRLKDFSF